MFHRTTRKARQWGGLRLILRTGCSIAITVLFAYLLPREHPHRDISAQIEPRTARVVPKLVSFEGPAASPAFNEDAQWFGLCSANAATTVAGFKTQVMSSPQLMERYKYFDWGN